MTIINAIEIKPVKQLVIRPTVAATGMYFAAVKIYSSIPPINTSKNSSDMNPAIG